MNGSFNQVSACVVVALFISGCTRQSASADRAQPDPIAVRIATPKHVQVSAEVVVSGTVETPSARCRPIGGTGTRSTTPIPPRRAG